MAFWKANFSKLIKFCGNRRILATGLFSFALLVPVKATAATFSDLFVFGDSLSDSGNSFEATGGAIPPSPPYFNGRFTNGLNWVDYLAQDLDLEADLFVEDPAPTAGVNFAFGGATTGSANTTALTFPQIPDLPGLQQQIDAFTLPLIQANRVADPDALYVLWAGANDYLPTRGSFEPFDEPSTPLNNLSEALTTLAGVGAKNILVANLPDLGDTPGSIAREPSVPGTVAQLNALTEAHNSGLSALLDELEGNLSSDVNLISLDVNSLFDRAVAEPSEFGFANVTTPCLAVQACVSSTQEEQNAFLFWDEQHPTTAGHRYVADTALATLESETAVSVPEPVSVLSLFAVGAFGAGALLRRQIEQS
jgi:phospholipase/lecithinase/hemolysin